MPTERQVLATLGAGTCWGSARGLLAAWCFGPAGGSEPLPSLPAETSAVQPAQLDMKAKKPFTSPTVW